MSEQDVTVSDMSDPDVSDISEPGIVVSLATFWDRNGEAQELESFPQSFQHWERGDSIDDDVKQVVLKKLENIFAKKVVRTELRAVERNIVLELQYEDGHEGILRMPQAVTSSDGEINQDVTLFTRELALLQWLKANVASLPIPRLLAVVHSSDVEPYSFSVMEKLQGDCLMNVFGDLPFDVKESIVRDAAGFMLQLNALDVPQQIGTTVARHDAVELVPLEFLALNFYPGRVFDTLEELIHSLFLAKRESERIGSDDASRARANAVLDRLAAKLPSIFKRLSSSIYRRCILSHDDMNETNILVDSDGRISVVDWELHSVRPVVLAAQYPVWLRYDGIYDPRFGLGEKWWVASPEDAARLRGTYAEAVKSKNEDYWRALVGGELLRQAYEWLIDPFVDPGCAAMEQWMDDALGSDSPVEVKTSLR